MIRGTTPIHEFNTDIDLTDAAVGEYSRIDANTLFAVGTGTSQVARKNAFEVVADGIVLLSTSGTRYKISVDDSGNINTTAL